MGGWFCCFWCNCHKSVSLRTREHLLPKCVGGNDAESNIRFACKTCNEERGRITSFYKQAKQVSHEMKRSRSLRSLRVTGNHLKTLWKQLPEITALHAKWTVIETDRLGRSFTAELPLILPPKKDFYRKVAAFRNGNR